MSYSDDDLLELLGGYLDGVLAEKEKVRVEELLGSDDRARLIHRQLMWMRTELSRQTTHSLPRGFGDRIVQESQNRARQLARSGVSAPVWISKDLSGDGKIRQASLVRSSSEGLDQSKAWRHSHRRAIELLLGLAASLAAIAYFSSQLSESDSGRQDMLAEVRTRDSGESSDAVDNASADIVESRRQRSSDSLAQSSNSSTDVESDSAAKVNPPAVRDMASDAAVEPEVKVPLPIESIAKDNPSIPSNASISEADLQMLQGFENALKEGKKLRLMMVLDLSVSQTAWEDKVLEGILDKHDIAMESPIVVSDQVKHDLEKSRMVGEQNAAAPLESNVALVFVKAKADRLDLMMREVFERVEEFPQVSFDIAMDLPSQEAIQNLESIQEFSEFDVDSQPGKTQGMARSLVLSPASVPNGLVAQFPAAIRRSRIQPIEERHQSKAPRSAMPGMNPVEYTLIIVRPKAE